MKRFSFTLTIAALAFMYSCFSQSQDNQAVKTDNGPAPKIEIVGGDTYDWKDVVFKNNTPLTAKIKIRNSGSAVLYIPEVRPGCGCTTAPLDNDTLQPGEEATLNVTLRIQNRSGNITKQITLTSNDPITPKKVLYLKANVNVPMELTPRDYFSFSDMKIGFESVSTLKLKNNSGVPVKILDYIITPENMSTDISRGKVLNPGETMDITVRVKPTKSGNFNSQLLLKTNHPDFPEIPLKGVGRVIESELFNNNNDNTSDKGNK